MFQNKENVVFAARTPAAGRLNPKTPFRVPLNDENNTGVIHPKTGKKLFGGRDPSQFVTPVGPRRPALAGKTTNVKARQLAPSGGKGKQAEINTTIKPSAPAPEIAVKPKSILEDEDYVPDIEYCPPPPVDLPYIPEDSPIDITEDLRDGKYMAGCHRAFLAGLDEDGKSKTQRDLEADFLRAEAELDEETRELLEELKEASRPVEKAPPLPAATSRPASRTAAVPSRTITASKVRRTVDTQRPSSSASARPSSRSASYNRPASRGAETSRPSSRTSTSRPASRGPSTSRASSRGPSTADSRKAAALLSNRPSTSTGLRGDRSHTRTASNGRPLGSFAQPTAASQIRARTVSTQRAAQAKHASRTMGYAVGREVQKTLAKPKRETAHETLARIQREDEERYGPVDEPGYMSPPIIDDDSIGAVDLSAEMQAETGLADGFLEIVDDADFMLPMPEY